MSDLLLADALASAALSPPDEREKLLAMPEDAIRAGVRAGDRTALAALTAQIDDFVDTDPFLSDFSRQLRRGDGPGCLTLQGGATWAPVRDPNGDWSAWGDWECWEECSIERVNGGAAVGPVPTGVWLTWHAPSKQVFGTPPGTTNARKKAEMMAVIQNAGKRTRVVPAGGDASASELDFAKLAVQVGAEMARLKGETGG